jgi:Flp pilus assembly protein TadG
MRPFHRSRRGGRARRGKTLVIFVLTLPALLGMTGLVIDSGLLLATQRAAQNGADAGALAATMELYRGSSSSSATSTATTFIQTYNGLSSSTVTINIPPTSGPYNGQTGYVEAIVSVPFTTSFIQILGVNSSQTVGARAVAGYEPIAAGQGAIVLNPNVPGITMNGNNTRLIVNGGITVNSTLGGVDQYGATVTSPLGNYGFRTQNSTQSPAPVAAVAIQVAGGIDTLDNFRAYDSTFPNYYDPNNTDRPVFANLQTQAPDPLINLPTPTTSNGVQASYYGKPILANGHLTSYASPQSVQINNSDTVTFDPGIYTKITLNGGTSTFNTGIYVLGPGLGNGNGQQTLSISNGATVNGSGVMFYNTGSDYTATTGAPDSSDGNTLGTDSNANFGQIAVNGGSVTLSPPPTGNTFAGVLFYQRRWNTQDASVGGNSATVNMTGTMYDKWGNFILAGQGTYNAEFVVGSMTISGNAAVTINATGKNQGRVNQVFLVE